MGTASLQWRAVCMLNGSEAPRARTTARGCLVTVTSCVYRTCASESCALAFETQCRVLGLAFNLECVRVRDWDQSGQHQTANRCAVSSAQPRSSVQCSRIAVYYLASACLRSRAVHPGGSNCERKRSAQCALHRRFPALPRNHKNC